MVGLIQHDSLENPVRPLEWFFPAFATHLRQLAWCYFSQFGLDGFLAVHYSSPPIHTGSTYHIRAVSPFMRSWPCNIVISLTSEASGFLR